MTVVAPYAGAWIETDDQSYDLKIRDVAPYAGAWIETARQYPGCRGEKMSLPTRERGLKLRDGAGPDVKGRGRSLRGSVD